MTMFNFNNSFNSRINPNRNPQDKFNFRRLLDQTPDANNYNEVPTQDSNFAQRYQELLRNTPNRLAYQNAMQEPEPVVSPGKMTRLSALLSGSGAALSGNPNSFNISKSIIDEPQQEATRKYKERNSRLAGLADVENETLSQKLKALTFEQEALFKNKDDDRQDKNLSNTIRNTDDEISNRKARLNADLDPNKASNWTSFVSKSTGKMMQLNETTHEVREVGQVDLTPDEEVKYSSKKAGAESSARLPSQLALEREQQKGAQKLAETNIAGREKVANINAKSKSDLAIAKLNSSAQTSTGAARQQKLDLAAALAADPTLADLPLNDLIEEKAGVLKVKENTGVVFDDSPEIQAAKKKLKAILEKGGAKTPVNPNQTKLLDPLGIR